MFATLESMPLAAPAMEWRNAAKGALPALEHFLHPTGRFVSTCRCPLGCGCAHRVVPITNDSYAGVCVCEDGGGCEDLFFNAADLEILDVSASRLGREIARALDCRPAFSGTAVWQTWQIGTWSAGAVPVLLTIPQGPRHLGRIIPELATRVRTRFILLCPTGASVNIGAFELAADTQSALFSLEALLRVTAFGRLEPIRGPGEVFAAFTSEAAELSRETVLGLFAVIRQLEARSPDTPPTVMTVFQLYCKESLSTAEIARRCRCSKTTVIDRLNRIRKATGTDPARFRQVASHFEKIEESLSDDRAQSIYRPS